MVSRLRIGDRVTTTEFPEDYPLMVLAIAGGRLAIGSPRWPTGANYAMEYHQITTINGVPVAFQQPQTKPARRRAA
jgi:hypothetical protein